MVEVAGVFTQVKPVSLPGSGHAGSQVTAKFTVHLHLFTLLNVNCIYYYLFLILPLKDIILEKI